MPPGPIPIWCVDAFTTERFRGNPAAVCVLDAPVDAAWMQSVAAEMNLSETAFVVIEPAPDGELGLRWFTPKAEVALCGHATLATAHVLYVTGRREDAAAIRFRTASGELTAARGADGSIELDFPALESVPVPAPDGLDEILGTGAVATARNVHDLLVEVADATAVRELQPDLSAIESIDVRGVLVTARADRGTGADFVSRFFAPRLGVPEDPVTGSAHCALAPYWSKRLGSTLLVGDQLSARGGRITCTVTADARVKLGGHAVTVWTGTLATNDGGP